MAAAAAAKKQWQKHTRILLLVLRQVNQRQKQNFCLGDGGKKPASVLLETRKTPAAANSS